MATEVGHEANRSYTDQAGAFHVNGAPFWDDNEVDVSDQLAGKARVVTAQGSATLTAAQSGTIFICAVDAVLTLPACSAALAGVRYTAVCGALSGGTGLSFSPAAADNIYGNGLTAVDDKDLINSGASDRLGDRATIVCDGTNWLIESVVGTWAKEA